MASPLQGHEQAKDVRSLSLEAQVDDIDNYKEIRDIQIETEDKKQLYYQIRGFYTLRKFCVIYKN